MMNSAALGEVDDAHQPEDDGKSQGPEQQDAAIAEPAVERGKDANRRQARRSNGRRARSRPRRSPAGRFRHRWLRANQRGGCVSVASAAMASMATKPRFPGPGIIEQHPGTQGLEGSCEPGVGLDREGGLENAQRSEIRGGVPARAAAAVRAAASSVSAKSDSAAALMRRWRARGLLTGRPAASAGAGAGASVAASGAAASPSPDEGGCLRRSAGSALGGGDERSGPQRALLRSAGGAGFGQRDKRRDLAGKSPARRGPTQGRGGPREQATRRTPAGGQRSRAKGWGKLSGWRGGVCSRRAAFWDSGGPNVGAERHRVPACLPTGQSTSKPWLLVQRSDEDGRA